MAVIILIANFNFICLVLVKDKMNQVDWQSKPEACRFRLESISLMSSGELFHSVQIQQNEPSTGNSLEPESFVIIFRSNLIWVNSISIPTTY